jgi:LPPG:FO 2-phospho-L-lactate transferase
MEALARSDVIVIGPSNPILSIWPILAVPGVADSIAAQERVIGVSPLIGGTALKGPAHRVLASMGHSPDTAGVISSYSGLLTDLVIDESDDEGSTRQRPRLHTANTRMDDLAASTKLAAKVLDVASE